MEELEYEKNWNIMFKLEEYKHSNKDDKELSIKYFLAEIKKDDVDAMNALGFYYYNVCDYENMMKYLMMAIEKGNDEAMHWLGIYYRYTKDNKNMLKYFLMACIKGCY